MRIKIAYQKEVHIYNPKADCTFEAIHKYIQEVFKNLPPKYYLTYFDDEDQITLACQSDFEAMKQVNENTTKLFIRQGDESYFVSTQKFTFDDLKIVDKMKNLVLQQNKSVADLTEFQLDRFVIEEPSEKTDEKTDEKKELIKSQNQPQIIEERCEIIKEGQISMLNSSRFNESQVSQITEADIEQKLKEMMPEFLEKVKSSLLSKEKTIHKHIICDQCGREDIEGIRYKCAVCSNFDLCEKCEATSSHDHPFLKIKHRGQAPYKLIAIIRDDQENSFEVNGNKVRFQQSPFFNQLFEAFCQRPGGFQAHGHGYRHGGGFKRQCNPHEFGFGRRSYGCPYQNNFQKNDQMGEQKVEQQGFSQKKTKIQEKPEPEAMKKVGQVPEQKIEAKKFEKRIPFEQKVQTSTWEQGIKQKEFNQIIENSKFLFNTLNGFVDISESQSYEFVKKYYSLSRQALLNKYIDQKCK